MQHVETIYSIFLTYKNQIIEKEWLTNCKQWNIMQNKERFFDMPLKDLIIMIFCLKLSMLNVFLRHLD